MRAAEQEGGDEEEISPTEMESDDVEERNEEIENGESMEIEEANSEEQNMLQEDAAHEKGEEEEPRDDDPIEDVEFVEDPIEDFEDPVEDAVEDIKKRDTSENPDNVETQQLFDHYCDSQYVGLTSPKPASPDDEKVPSDVKPGKLLSQGEGGEGMAKEVIPEKLSKPEVKSKALYDNLVSDEECVEKQAFQAGHLEQTVCWNEYNSYT